MAARGIFQGYALQQVDDKGRVAIPASLRQTLLARASEGDDPRESPQVVIGIHADDKCLVGYDPASADERFAVLEARAEGQVGPTGAPRHDIVRAGMVLETLAFDGSGRFILPAFPRKSAGIGRFAFFIGMGRHFEIWDPATVIASPTAAEVMKDAVRFFMEERGERL